MEIGVRKMMDDLENVPDRVNFVPCVKWVRRGKAKATPDKVQLDQSELAAIIEQTKSKLEESERDIGDDDEEEEEDDDENEAKNGDEKMDSEKVKQGSAVGESKGKVKVEEGERDIEAEYDLDNYDEDDKGGGNALFGLGDLVFDPRNDEYQQEEDAADDASDAEDFEIKPNDNLILVGHVEGDASILEVYGTHCLTLSSSLDNRSSRDEREVYFSIFIDIDHVEAFQVRKDTLINFRLNHVS